MFSVFNRSKGDKKDKQTPIDTTIRPSTTIASITPPTPAPDPLPIIEKRMVMKTGNRLSNLMVNAGVGGNPAALTNTIQLSSQYRLAAGKNHIAKLTSTDSKTSTYYPVSFDEDLGEKLPEDKVLLNLFMRNGLKYQYDSSAPDKSTIAPPIELFVIENDAKPTIAYKIDIEIKRALINDELIKLDNEDLTEQVKEKLAHYPLSKGQTLIIQYPEKPNGLELFIQNITDEKGHEVKPLSPPAIYKLDDKTQIKFTLARNSHNLLLSTKPKLNLNFVDMGIGGHKEQLEELVRGAFNTRALGNENAAAYGISHSKGILLYGPPGTGKTLIARQIGKLFSKNTEDKVDRVKIVNGPELKNSFHGKDAENLRNVFAPAVKEWKEKGENSPLHVLIFDEIDSLLPRRGSHTGGTGADEDLVSQFLTLLDGVDSPGNILVIGMTNRKELMDPAVLRPGRLGSHIQIGLPDEKARYEILLIKTKQMRENHLLDEKSVDLKQWAKETSNFSGAEIEELVKKSVQFAASTNFDNSKKDELVLKKEIKSIQELAKVNDDHFQKAFAGMTPAFGTDENNLHFNKDKFLVYNNELKAVVNDYQFSINMLKSNSDTHSLNFLLSGRSGVGKSDLAKYLAVDTGAQYIKVISANELLNLSPVQQLNYLEDEFNKAHHSDLSVIILDDIENILQADPQLRVCNNSVRLKIESLLKANNESDTQCIVIATTRSHQFMEDMQLATLFAESKAIHNIVLDCKNEEDLATLAKMTTSLGFTFAPPEKKTENESRQINLPIRDLIYHIKMFCSHPLTKKTLEAYSFQEYVERKQHAEQHDSKRDTRYKQSSASGPTLFKGATVVPLITPAAQKDNATLSTNTLNL